MPDCGHTVEYIEHKKEWLHNHENTENPPHLPVTTTTQNTLRTHLPATAATAAAAAAAAAGMTGRQQSFVKQQRKLHVDEVSVVHGFAQHAWATN
jgi:hypothetical protein